MQQDNLRNLLAYKCFGTTEIASFLRDPFGPPLKTYGLLDSLRPNQLTDCDVPLGVLYWTLADGIKFVDMWSVRRRITENGADNSWLPLVSDRRSSEVSLPRSGQESHRPESCNQYTEDSRS